jgi:glycosyltransferase involved in cell wall biosynthesis
MAKITALIHTLNDGLRLGRTLDSLRACDEVLVVDHGSTDNTRKVASEHGAKCKEGIPGVNRGAYAVDAGNDWVLCLRPTESLSESLEASLFEWKSRDHDDDLGFIIPVREESDAGWKPLPAEMRLINKCKMNWTGDLPPSVECDELPGHILRFDNP